MSGFSHKRSRRESRNFCGDCGDGFDMDEDEWCTCCHCEAVLCERCWDEKPTCTGCEEALARGEDVSGVNMCESCYNSCEACGTSYCNGCFAEHQKTCTSKTRAERVMATVDQAIEKKEKEVALARGDIFEAEIRLKNAEAELKQARQKKAAAEVELGLNTDSAPTQASAGGAAAEAAASASTSAAPASSGKRAHVSEKLSAAHEEGEQETEKEAMEKKPRVKKEESSSIPEHEKKRARVQFCSTSPRE